jgi:hypothetical protein
LPGLVPLQPDVVNKACRQKRGLIKSWEFLVKILEGIILAKPITVIANKFSQSAAKATEQASDKAVLLLDKLQEQ